MDDIWKEYAADFDNMTDIEIEQARQSAQDLIDENESWTEAVASWEAAGKPRTLEANTPSPEIDDLIARVRNAPPMTPAEIQEQRESWVRGMCTPCEHGVVDFEQCVDCRTPRSQQGGLTDE